MNCGLVLKAGVDLACTVLLAYYLHMHKSAFRSCVAPRLSAWRLLMVICRTRYMVEKLVFYAICTGALTMYVPPRLAGTWR